MKTRSTRRRGGRWLIVFAALALLGAACDSGSSNDAEGETAPPAEERNDDAAEDAAQDDAGDGEGEGTAGGPVSTLTPESSECGRFPADGGAPEATACDGTLAVDRLEALCGGEDGRNCREELRIEVAVAECCAQFEPGATGAVRATVDLFGEAEGSGLTCIYQPSDLDRGLCVGTGADGEPQELDCGATPAVAGDVVQLTIGGDCFDAYEAVCGDACAFATAGVVLQHPDGDPAFESVRNQIPWPDLPADMGDLGFGSAAG